MYNLLISFAGGLIAFVVAKVAGAPAWAAFCIAVLLFVGLFYLLSRIIMKKVMDMVEAASRDLQAQRVEKGIRTLQEALNRYGKWQIYVTGQMNAQIGMIHYMKRDFSDAFPFLEKAFFKNWVAMGMLAITYMKRKNNAKMIETFDKAVRGTPKESLLWNLYAYCLNETGDTAKAIATLEQGLKRLPGDEKLEHNLEALREGKKMKMKNFGEMWLQFHLEKPSAVMKQQAAAMGIRRRVVRR